MDALYLLIPLSVVLVLLIGGVLVWAVLSGQFERLDDEGARILAQDVDAPASGNATSVSTTATSDSPYADQSSSRN